MQLAAILFVLTALGGGLMAAIRLSGKPYPPLWLALGHGLLGLSALGTLGYAATTEGIPFLGQVALGMFVLTALGGAGLLAGFHLQNKPLPIPFVLGHGGLAIASLIVLLLAIYS